VSVSRLEKIVTRNERALRDSRRKVAWAIAIALALIAVAIALAMGVGMPDAPPPRMPDHGHVNGVLLR
jgi:hypothetical protein